MRLPRLLPALALYICLILYPTQVIVGIRDSLDLCIKTLVPTIFPFAVVTNMLVGYNCEIWISQFIKKPFEYLFHLNSNLAFAYILGIFSGYPQGAVAILAVYEKGGCTKEEAEHALCFCNNTGIAFLLGAVPVIFNNSRLGIQLFTVQLVSSFIYAVIFRPKGIIKTNILPETEVAQTEPILVSSVMRAIRPTVTVSAFVMLFGALGTLINDLFIHYSLSPLFSSILLCFLEITNASGYLSQLESELSLPLMGFAVCFSGICVHLQIAGCLKNKLSMKRFFTAKLFQGICAFLIILIFKIY